MTVYDADNTQQLIAPSPRVTGSVMRTTSIATPAQLPTSSWGTVDSSFTDLGYTDETGLKQRSENGLLSCGGNSAAEIYHRRVFSSTLIPKVCTCVHSVHDELCALFCFRLHLVHTFSGAQETFCYKLQTCFGLLGTP